MTSVEDQLAMQQNSTVFCTYCSAQLSYPQGSVYIQCPKCRNTMSPDSSQHTNCIRCRTLLAHPANTIYIQCPKCYATMNVRENRQIKNGYTFNSGTIPRNIVKPAKKRKDPNAPKAASNAYMIFCKERRAKLKELHPELPFGQLGAKLGEMWRSLPAAEKKPYEERASQDRERYRKQMEMYSIQVTKIRLEEQTQLDLEQQHQELLMQQLDTTHVEADMLQPSFKRLKPDETEPKLSLEDDQNRMSRGADFLPNRLQPLSQPGLIQTQQMLKPVDHPTIPNPSQQIQLSSEQVLSQHPPTLPQNVEALRGASFPTSEQPTTE